MYLYNITYIYEPINYDGFCFSSSLRFWDPPKCVLFEKNQPTVSRPSLWQGKKPWLLHGLNFRVDAWEHRTSPIWWCEDFGGNS